MWVSGGYMSIKNLKNVSRKRKIFTIVSLIILGVFCLVISFVVHNKVRYYDTRVFPNSYLKDYNISDISFDKLEERLVEINNEVLDSKVVLCYNNYDLEYKLGDLGVKLDIDAIMKDIVLYQDALKYNDKVIGITSGDKKNYKFYLSYNEEVVVNLLNDLKSKYDVGLQNEAFVVDYNRNVKYISGVDSYYLDVDSSIKKIMDTLKNGVFNDIVIELVGVSEKALNHDSYKSIDTKVSSFTTYFNPYIVRATNLKSALNFIDGVVIEPGEIFSFYKYAGPYNKPGYVFYYEYVGNGVCQIATTVYNAALLGGLEIVKRYPHAAKSTYVLGGLDATVASYSDGSYLDFQFKNTYSYPIYISAWASGGYAHVDFWSNSNATDGKTYSTSSVQIGHLGYNTFLHTFKDGVEIDRSKIATTWYTKES